MLSNVLTWLDASPVRYWSVAWGTFGVTAALALAFFFSGRASTSWRQQAIFVGMLLLTLVAFRWPVLGDNQQLLDPDESQLMSGAMTLTRDPAFWRSVDGTTHGPLAEAPLLVPLLAGGALDYTAARSISVLLGWCTLLCAWLVFRHVFGARLAGLLVLPLLATHAFTQEWSFAAFCSEHAPAALLAVGCAALWLAWDSNGRAPRPGRLFGAGVALGAVPFAKLQGAPMAAAAVIGGIGLVLATRDSSWRERGRAAGALVAGATFVPAITLGAVLLGGIWPDFWASYILNNLQYAGGRWFTWAETPRKLVELGANAPGFNPFFFWLTGFAGCALLAMPRFTSWHRLGVLLAATLLVVTAYAVMAPGRMFMHYLQLLLFPAGLFAGLAAGALLEATRGEKGAAGSFPGFRQIMVLAVFLGCGLAPQVVWRARNGQPYLGRFTATRGAFGRTEVALEILRHAQPGERLGMWGWMPTFWVQTGMIQGTRDGNSYRQIEAIPDRASYRARYLRDLRQSQPPVFIDAVGGDNFSFKDRAAAGHETFPELQSYIAANYRLIRDVDGTRIYVRNDR